VRESGGVRSNAADCSSHRREDDVSPRRRDSLERLQKSLDRAVLEIAEPTGLVVVPEPGRRRLVEHRLQRDVRHRPDEVD